LFTAVNSNSKRRRFAVPDSIAIRRRLEQLPYPRSSAFICGRRCSRPFHGIVVNPRGQ